MSQSKKHSHYEVITNQIVGSLGGFMIVYLIFPLFQHLEQIYVAWISTVIFFVWSYFRSYVIRRIFNKGLKK